MAKVSLEIVADASGVARAFASARSSARKFNRDIGQTTRGTIAGSGAFRGLGRSVAFASAGFLGGAGISAALVSTVRKAGDFQASLNQLQSVSHATGAEMKAAAAQAQKLGADITLPATSALDAAGAMTELAKGGLTVRDAMAAAKGTLQLSAAAQIDGAQAAQIQANALNQFGLAGGKAGLVADVLANAANAASGEVTDMATALSYVGPVAASVGENITNTGTAIALLAKNGILGDKAGTALRGSIASLARPTRLGKKGLKELGVQAFDNKGRFLGFRSVIEQLHKSQGRLTKQQFAAAASMAFGKEPLAAISALAREGAGGFDKMSVAVGRQGGAAQVAAARNKGFNGAMDGLKSAVESVQIQLGTQLLPVLTRYLRQASQWLSNTRNQKRIQHDFREAISAVGTALRGLQSVFQTISRVAGGTKNAIKALVAAFVLFKAVKIGASAASDLGLIGKNARNAKGEVRLLRRALVSLATNPILIPIGLAIAGDKLTGGHNIATDLKKTIEGKGGVGDALFGSRESNNVFNKIAHHFGKRLPPEKNPLTQIANAQLRQLNPGRGRSLASDAQKLARDTLDKTNKAVADAFSHAKPGGLTAAQRQKQIQNRNQFFDALTDRKLDRVQDLRPAAQLSALNQISSALTARIAATKDITRKQTLEDKLLSVQRQSKQVRDQIAQDFLDGLQFNVDKAATTAGLGDDLAALGKLQAQLRKRVAADKTNLDLQRQLLGVNEQIKTTKTQQIAARQFKTLGLTATGEEKIPGVKNLRKRLGNFSQAVKGTVLDTTKTRQQINRIRKVLSENLVPKDVRAKLKEMLDGLTDELKNHGQKTSFKHASTTAVLAGLGLSPDQTRALRSRLSQIGPGGTVPGSHSLAFSGAGSTTVNTTINLDGKTVAKNTTAHQRKADKRRTTSRRGVFAGPH